MNIPRPLNIVEKYIESNEVLKNIVEEISKDMLENDKFPIETLSFTANTTEKLTYNDVQAIKMLFEIYGWSLVHHYSYNKEDDFYKNIFMVTEKK